MGPLPDPSRRVPLDVKIESREETPDYVRIKLTYAAGAGRSRAGAAAGAEDGRRSTRTALAAMPKRDRDQWSRLWKKLPAMLCLHPTNPDGKAQTAGLVGEPTRHYGHQLAQRGFVCLIPDYPSFGDYKAYDFKQKRPGSDRAALCQRHDEGDLEQHPGRRSAWNRCRYVDTENIGAIGHSLGGHNALFTAVFEPRLKAVVTSCGFTAFHDYYKGRPQRLDQRPLHAADSRRSTSNDPDKMPFDFPEVLAAIAPRGRLCRRPAARQQLRSQRRAQVHRRRPARV